LNKLFFLRRPDVSATLDRLLGFVVVFPLRKSNRTNEKGSRLSNLRQKNFG
jgi:hypothetical protein